MLSSPICSHFLLLVASGSNLRLPSDFIIYPVLRFSQENNTTTEEKPRNEKKT